MQAEHSLVLSKLAEQIAHARTSIAYAEQGNNRAPNPEEHRRTYELIKQRRRELAYWLDIYQFAEQHRRPSPEGMVDADAGDPPRPGWLYGPSRPAFDPEGPGPHPAADGLSYRDVAAPRDFTKPDRRSHGSLAADNEGPAQHD